jgi:hypothetical protein
MGKKTGSQFAIAGRVRYLAKLKSPQKKPKERSPKGRAAMRKRYKKFIRTI